MRRRICSQLFSGIHIDLHCKIAKVVRRFYQRSMCFRYASGSFWTQIKYRPTSRHFLLLLTHSRSKHSSTLRLVMFCLDPKGMVLSKLSYTLAWQEVSAVAASLSGLRFRIIIALRISLLFLI